MAQCGTERFNEVDFIIMWQQLMSGSTLNCRGLIPGDLVSPTALASPVSKR